MDKQQRIAQILAAQFLTAPDTPVEVAGSLNGIQAQFHSYACHSLAIRTAREPLPGELVKSWTVRGTMHAFPIADLSLYLHQGRAHFLRPADMLEVDGPIPAKRKKYFARCVQEAVAAGIKTREGLKEACVQAGMTEEEGQCVFNAWGGTIRALCEHGVLCYEFAQEKAFALCPPFTPMPLDEALKEQLRRYFAGYGPATLRDAAYFFGLPQKRLRELMDHMPLQAITLDGKRYFFLHGKESPPDIPACLLLGGFDPLLLGYRKEESPFLPREYLREIFTLSGIVLPGILLRGEIAGRWKRQGKNLTFTLFRGVAPAEREAILDCAAGLWPVLGKIQWEEL